MEKKEKTMPFGVNLLRSGVLYRAAQVLGGAYASSAVVSAGQQCESMSPKGWSLPVASSTSGCGLKRSE